MLQHQHLFIFSPEGDTYVDDDHVVSSEVVAELGLVSYLADLHRPSDSKYNTSTS